jgi:hypothetical protein
MFCNGGSENAFTVLKGFLPKKGNLTNFKLRKVGDRMWNNNSGNHTYL